MGEGILLFGLRNIKRRYTRTLQAFAKKVLTRGRANGSIYIFGNTHKSIIQNLHEKGIDIKATKTAITDKTIIKYKNHPKKSKGAVVSFNRFIMVEAAVRHPKHTYIDTKRDRLVYVSNVKYAKDKVLKVIIEPNQKLGRNFYNKVVSIGVVNKSNLRTSQYKKIW